MTEELKKSYTFNFVGMNKELSLNLNGEIQISDLLTQLSTFCEIKPSSLQIRNGNEFLNDTNKKLDDYTIEDPKKLNQQNLTSLHLHSK